MKANQNEESGGSAGWLKAKWRKRKKEKWLASAAKSIEMKYYGENEKLNENINGENGSGENETHQNPAESWKWRKISASIMKIMAAEKHRKRR